MTILKTIKAFLLGGGAMDNKQNITLRVRGADPSDLSVTDLGKMLVKFGDSLDGTDAVLDSVQKGCIQVTTYADPNLAVQFEQDLFTAGSKAWRGFSDIVDLISEKIGSRARIYIERAEQVITWRQAHDMVEDSSFPMPLQYITINGVSAGVSRDYRTAARKPYLKIHDFLTDQLLRVDVSDLSRHDVDALCRLDAVVEVYGIGRWELKDSERLLKEFSAESAKVLADEVIQDPVSALRGASGSEPWDPIAKLKEYREGK